jgi:hypothetical protein
MHRTGQHVLLADLVHPAITPGRSLAYDHGVARSYLQV